MKRSIYLLGTFWAILSAWTAVGLAANAPAPADRSTQAWIPAMLAARANCDRVAQNDAPANAKPFVGDILRGDAGVAQHISLDVTGCGKLRLMSTIVEGVGNCHVWGDAKLIAKDGKVTYLGSLKPLSIHVGWGQLHVDRNWQAHKLQIGCKVFEHGIWVHGDSDVIYPLDKKYVRFEAWAGLDQDRPTGAAKFQVRFDGSLTEPAVWQALAETFPQQSAWMIDDLPHGQHMQWFSGTTTTRLEESMISRVVGETNATVAADVRKALAALRTAKTPAQDPRWLELYARACRYRECARVLRGIPVKQIWEQFDSKLTQTWQAQASADDPRWIAQKTAITQIAQSLAGLHELDPAALRPAIDDIAKLPGADLRSIDELKKRISDLDAKWAKLPTALMQNDPAAMTDAPALCQELANIRRSFLLAVGGMKDFLAQTHFDAENEWQSQFQSLQHDLANRAHFTAVAAETLRPESLIQPSDRDPADVVLRRTAALLADLKTAANAPRIDALQKELADLQEASAKIDPANAEARYVLYAAACKTRRQIVFANPVMNCDQLVFIKRHRSTYNHMCDQYYGTTARPGGALCILSGAMGPNPQVRDVLANSIVQNGRLKGRKLEGGCFVSPAVDYDGKTIYFAYTECTGSTAQIMHLDPMRGHWNEGRCYHIFRVNVDGSGLTQLTDGTFNDFAPCPLPNGRIAFITERRGGYLRCGRACPNYTLFDMAADGSDINSLSVHETNEWFPSVTHDGRIIYTRWDYVDRHGCTAHLPWITTLDGRDSRALHGNFAPRQLRPDMELNILAVPGSPKYVATAAPHHGQSYGSLVLIDPRVQDDDAMGPVKRITPDVAFPESQGGSETYGTPWPLSESCFLCCYDAAMTRAPEMRSGRGNYGLYVVDACGNKELIYRDPNIACQSPIPLRPTAKQPLSPELACSANHYNPSAKPADQQRPGQATLSVVNVYDSLRPWPAGTKIKELRVLQLVPMSVPSGGPPHDTGVRIAGAGDSVVTVRRVLGTVPVEEDGSASFIVPANREMFFQAIDENGLAIQSMRSATYLREGEHLVCQGCHEPRHETPRPGSTVPMALRRAPSICKTDVAGSNPFSYPQLVQPVLDRNCVSCHEKNAPKAPNLGREPIVHHWYASYNTLVPRFAFTSYGNGLVTIPGQFGAKASALYAMLMKGHHDVKLSPEDMHRITLWLDCSSMFYGVYEKEGGEAQLQGKDARPTLE